MDMWLIGALVVLLTLAWRILSAWRESYVVPAKLTYQVGDLTSESLEFYNGYDIMRPILVAVKGVLYDVSSQRSSYGPGKDLHVFAGKECSRALALGTLSEDDCNGNLDGLSPSELARLDSKVEELEKVAPRVGQVVAPAQMTPKELMQHDGTDPTRPMYISIKGTIYDVTDSKQYYGPDGIYPFAGREVARAFALNSLELDDCHDDLSELTKWDLDNLQQWEWKFKSKYKIIGTLVK